MGFAARTSSPEGSGHAVWEDTAPPEDLAALDPGIPDDWTTTPDVLVVGGGVVGLATAVFCRRAGLRVLLAERGRLAGGPSGRAAGGLSPDIHLEQRYRVIAWDLRGHGESGAPDDPEQYSHDLLVGDMLALLKHFEADQAVLVGHSLGGFGSLRFYLDHPDMVRALVLFGSGPGYRDPEARGKWNAMAERAASGMEKYGLEILQRGSLEVRTAKHRSAQAIAHAGRRMLAQFDGRVMDALTDIAVPTLVIVGSEDKAFIGSSEYMARKISGSRLVVLEGAGHAASIEKADEFNAALLEFMDSLP